MRHKRTPRQLCSPARFDRVVTWFLCGLLAWLVISCATTGPGGKTSLIIIPTNQEVAIGASMAQQVEESEEVFRDSLWQQYLDDVGQRIAAVCDRQDIEYHFTVIKSDQVNAFAAPGGYIYFYTGLLRHMETEAEMAAVVAHELSHVVARHSIKRLQTAMGVSLAWELVFGEDASKAVTAAAQIGLLLAFSEYSRDHEREADRFGIHYMLSAGYDPSGAIGMFEKLAALGGAGDATVFEKLASSHPGTQERMANARAQIAEMQPSSEGLRVGAEDYRRMRMRLPEPQSDAGAGGR